MLEGSEPWLSHAQAEVVLLELLEEESEEEPEDDPEELVSELTPLLEELDEPEELELPRASLR